MKAHEIFWKGSTYGDSRLIYKYRTTYVHAQHKVTPVYGGKRPVWVCEIVRLDSQDSLTLIFLKI
ncbi:MAG: hypothetical protein CVU46_06485 [Chloroflexi bacterium HGW-Chloroflexi-8]|nr:MAG: hypothetical protein CVU46_06485 [Chloroflexi bacterium HGW-Chloroflexi-8]